MKMWSKALGLVVLAFSVFWLGDILGYEKGLEHVQIETKYVDVPGPVQYIDVPGTTKYIDVPGPVRYVTRIEKVRYCSASELNRAELARKP